MNGFMYQSYEAVVKNGRIRLVEKIRLREATRMLVTVVAGKESEQVPWARLRAWIKRQRTAKKFKSCHSIEESKNHLRQLTKS